jgi:hypothetical protein
MPITIINSQKIMSCKNKEIARKICYLECQERERIFPQIFLLRRTAISVSKKNYKFFWAIQNLKNDFGGFKSPVARPGGYSTI